MSKQFTLSLFTSYPFVIMIILLFISPLYFMYSYHFYCTFRLHKINTLKCLKYRGIPIRWSVRSVSFTSIPPFAIYVYIHRLLQLIKGNPYKLLD